MKWSRLAIAAMLVLAGCQPMSDGPGRAAIAPPARFAWLDVAVPRDVEKIERLDEAWSQSLGAARADGFARRVAAEGALLDPAAALPRPAPPPGAWLCRLIRIGASGRGEPAFAAFRPFYCFVSVNDDNALSITKSEGSQRPAGYLWDDEDPTRMIFLGTLAPGRGPVQAYGDERARDVAGIFERIGAFRYRLVIPSPEGAPAIDIFELVPAPVQASE